MKREEELESPEHFNVRGVNTFSHIVQQNGAAVVERIVVVQVDRGEGAFIQTIIALAIVFVAVQIASVIWMRYHEKSFSAVSTLVFLLFPFISAVTAGAWMFAAVWVAVALGHLIFFGTVFFGRRPTLLTMNIYLIYRSIFRCSIYLSGAGYIMLAIGFFKQKLALYRIGVLVLTYVLYFTIVVRTGMNYLSGKANRSVLPTKRTVKTEPEVCPWCRKANDKECIALECKEVFHQACIKSWKIIGKRDTCPSCREEVSLSGVSMTPWEKKEYLFSQFLEFTKNLLLSYAATQCVIFFLSR